MRPPPANLLAPQLDVSETDAEIRITAELPGVSENDIQVQLEQLYADVLRGSVAGVRRLELAWIGSRIR